MALSDNELFASATVSSRKRIVPSRLAVKKLAATAVDLAAGLLMAFNTATELWVPWVSGGANGTGTCKGILWPDPVDADAANEQLAQIMLRGIAHRDDIELGIETQNNVDAELKDGLRDIGIDIQGLDGVR